MVDKRSEALKAPDRGHSKLPESQDIAAKIQRRLLESQPDGASAGQTVTSRTDVSSDPDKVPYGDAQKLVVGLQKDKPVAPPRDSSRLLPKQVASLERDSSHPVRAVDEALPLARYDTFAARDLRIDYYDELDNNQKKQLMNTHDGLKPIHETIQSLSAEKSSLETARAASIDDSVAIKRRLDDLSRREADYPYFQQKFDGIQRRQQNVASLLGSYRGSEATTRDQAMSIAQGQLRELSSESQQLTKDWIALKTGQSVDGSYKLGPNEDLGMVLKREKEFLEREKPVVLENSKKNGAERRDILRRIKEVDEELKQAKVRWYEIERGAGKGKKQDSE